MTNPMQAISDLAASEDAAEQAFQEWARKHTAGGRIAELGDAFGRLIDAVIEQYANWRTVAGMVVIWVLMVVIVETFGW